jgi:acetolactate synthase-1/2/3 large subunit
MTDWRRMPVPRELIQIDLDAEQIGMNHPVTVGIVADARAAVRALVSAVSPPRQRDGWGTLWEEARAARPSKPEWLIDSLREVLPGEVPVFTDACEMGYRMQADWPSYGPRRFFYPSNFITLGWAFPAAVGAAVALGGGPVLSVSGDGGFVMTAQELATAVRYRLRVIALVHNDSTYGAIKNIQKRAHEGRYLDVELNNPDFLQLAAAFGVPGSRVRGPEELKAAVRDALNRDGPSLIEVPDEWRFLRDLATPVR